MAATTLILLVASNLSIVSARALLDALTFLTLRREFGWSVGGAFLVADIAGLGREAAQEHQEQVLHFCVGIGALRLPRADGDGHAQQLKPPSRTLKFLLRV